jgi:hypothetical protein
MLTGRGDKAYPFLCPQKERDRMEYSVLVIHGVEDYRKWRPVFDQHEEARLEAGVSEPHVFRNVDKPNEIVVQFTAGNVRLARAFFASDDLKRKMDEAGVLPPPTIYFLEEV